MLEEDIYNVIKSKIKGNDGILMLDARLQDMIKNECIYFIGETIKLMKEFYVKYLDTHGTKYSSFLNDELWDKLHKFWEDD